MSLRDFVASDRLSKGNLRFNGQRAEAETFPPSGPRAPGGGSGTNDEKWQHAARLALLLAKTFVNLEQENAVELASLRMDHFFVQ